MYTVGMHKLTPRLVRMLSCSWDCDRWFGGVILQVTDSKLFHQLVSDAQLVFAFVL